VIDAPPPPPNRPPLGFAVAWTLFALFTFLAVGGTAQLLQLAWGLWFSEVALFAGLAVIGWQLVGFDAVRAMGLQRHQGRGLALGFAFGAANYVGWAVPIMALAQQVFPRSMIERFDSAQVFDRHSPVDLAVVLAGVSLAAPLGEELFFRGFLQRQLGLHVPAPRAVVVTAFVFSAFHLDPVGLTARFELGVLFGLLAWRMGSIWPAVAAHAANNFISSMLILLAGAEAREGALPGWVPAAMFVAGNAALFSLLRLARAELSQDRPVELVEQPAPSVARAFAPWALGGLLSAGVVLALDWRGVRLNLMDAVMGTTKEIRKTEGVRALRAQVRRGEAGFEEYEVMVSELKEAPPPPPQGEGAR
jgi:membrane protease YdiL (CAAX protease family)